MWLQSAVAKEILFADESLLPQSCPADHPAALLLSAHDSNKTPIPNLRHPLEDALLPVASPVILRGHCPR